MWQQWKEMKPLKQEMKNTSSKTKRGPWCFSLERKSKPIKLAVAAPQLTIPENS